jgi:hypothetical protein
LKLLMTLLISVFYTKSVTRFFPKKISLAFQRHHGHHRNHYSLHEHYGHHSHERTRDTTDIPVIRAIMGTNGIPVINAIIKTMESGHHGQHRCHSHQGHHGHPRHLCYQRHEHLGIRPLKTNPDVAVIRAIMGTHDISSIKDMNTLESGHYRQTQMSQSSGPSWAPETSLLSKT